MHENAVKKIVGTILGSLERCVVIDNWPQYESLAAHVESLSKEVLKHKSEWLSISDVYSIYYDLVYEAIIEKAGPEDKISGLLPELLEDDGLQILSKRLSEFYISVPRKYSIYLPLPSISKNIGRSFILSDSLELICFDNADDIPGGYKRGLLQITNKLELNKVYLKINTSGYCNSNLENRTLKKSLSNYKILIQQGLFRGLFKFVEGQPAGLGMLSGSTHYQIPKSNLISVDKTGSGKKVVSTELPIEFSKLLDSIDINWTNEIDEKSLNEENFEKYVKKLLKQPNLLIESSEPEADRIKAAIEWCFDSITNENETISFIQICIGLESILGDNDSGVSLTKTLADRCAYLVGNNIKGRGTIKSEFIILYQIRSKLVHGVKVALEHDQKRYKKFGKIILELSIEKEIEHLNLA